VQKKEEERRSRAPLPRRVVMLFIGLGIFLYMTNIFAACEYKASIGAGECFKATVAEEEALKAFSLQ
jgi:hypothetical protein